MGRLHWLNGESSKVLSYQHYWKTSADTMKGFRRSTIRLSSTLIKILSPPDVLIFCCTLFGVKRVIMFTLVSRLSTGSFPHRGHKPTRTRFSYKTGYQMYTRLIHHSDKTTLSQFRFTSFTPSRFTLALTTFSRC